MKNLHELLDDWQAKQENLRSFFIETYWKDIVENLKNPLNSSNDFKDL